MRLNRYAELRNKSFLNGATFNDFESRPVTQDASSDPNLIMPRVVYPTPPASLDYRTMGYVTPVEDQGKSLKLKSFILYSNFALNLRIFMRQLLCICSSMWTGRSSSKEIWKTNFTFATKYCRLLV